MNKYLNLNFKDFLILVILFTHEFRRKYFSFCHEDQIN